MRRTVPPDPRHEPGRPQRVRVFAVEDTTVQVCWSALGPGHVAFRTGAPGAGTIEHKVETDGGPGACTIEGLQPGTRYAIDVDGPGGSTLVRATTLTPPAGRPLVRFATISDIHVGIPGFGLGMRMRELPRPAIPHAERALRAAIDELVDWGAELLVVKGDVTDGSRIAQWEKAAHHLHLAGIPVVVIPGNHDNGRGHAHPARIAPAEAFERFGLDGVVGGILVRDLPGVRVIATDTTTPGHHGGRVAPVHDAVVAAAAEARADGRGAFVALHHHPHQLPFQWFWPPGIERGEANHFLGAMAAANPASLLSNGHTHRNRHRRVGPLHLTEVGSTKDHPGVWAGYEVYERGIRQVVRRIEEPSVIRWTEHTRRACLGVWGHWSTGRLRSRCFSVSW